MNSIGRFLSRLQFDWLNLYVRVPPKHSSYSLFRIWTIQRSLDIIDQLRMGTTSIQDRTAEFRAVLAQAQKRQSSSKIGPPRQSVIAESQRKAVNGSPNGEIQGRRKGARSEFARKAAEIGRGITGTMEKLGRLAECMSPLKGAPHRTRHSSWCSALNHRC